MPGLRVLTSGPLPPNPAELLGSQRMLQLLDELVEETDVVFFDSPPLLAMADASLLVLMTGDSMAWAKSPERYWKNAPKEVADLLVGWMGPFHEGREWLQRDEAQRSIGMAAQTLMLAAKSMGYDSCPMIGFDIEGVAKLIDLPDDHVMGPMVAIGKGIKKTWPKPGQLSLEELVVENGF